MRLDKFSNIVFNESDLFHALYSGEEINLDLLKTLLVDDTDEIRSLEKITDIQCNFANNIDQTSTIEEVDHNRQKEWFIPESYLTFDIKQFCLDKCTTTVQQQRVKDEIAAFENKNMMPVLRWMKYFVDTCTEQNVIWGVGRGSSVASYVLFLLDVHAIDSLKYNLDWQDFLR